MGRILSVEEYSKSATTQDADAARPGCEIDDLRHVELHPGYSDKEFISEAGCEPSSRQRINGAMNVALCAPNWLN